LHNNQRALATQTEASQHAAEAQLKQAELQAITDVDKAYQSYLSARQVLDLYSTDNLSALDRLRTVANVSYREGASSLFELLDAQRAYALAMTSYNQARADYQTALWQLEQAIGRPLR
jgi:cobalt-zinc-cadmium efflux system outer membrane protein